MPIFNRITNRATIFGLILMLGYVGVWTLSRHLDGRDLSLKIQDSKLNKLNSGSCNYHTLILGGSRSLAMNKDKDYARENSIYNYSMANMGTMLVHHKVLKKYIDCGSRPDTVVLSLGPLLLNKYADLFADETEINSERNIGVYRASRFFTITDMFYYPEFYKKLSTALWLIYNKISVNKFYKKWSQNIDETLYVPETGFAIFEKNVSWAFDPENDIVRNKMDTSSSATKQLKKALKLARDEGIEVALYVMPIPASTYILRLQQDFYDDFVDIVNELKSEFPDTLSIFPELPYYPDRLFIDGSHLNEEGATHFNKNDFRKLIDWIERDRGTDNGPTLEEYINTSRDNLQIGPNGDVKLTRFDGQMKKETVQNVGVRHDLNGDARSDLIWVNKGTGAVSVWMFGEDGEPVYKTFPKRIDKAWEMEAIGDFDGDGRSEILWRNSTNGEIVTWGYTIDGNVESIYIGARSKKWSLGGVGDVDLNGTSDLLWRNQDDGALVVWRMRNSIPEGSSFIRNEDLAWKVIGLEKVSGDGTAEICFRHNSTGVVLAWQTDGRVYRHTDFRGGLSLVPHEFETPGFGDFDGDGRTDFVWRNSKNGYVYIWLMDDINKIRSWSLVSETTIDWKIIHIGDYNGDGRSDIMWRNVETGANVKWQMNGASIESFAALPALSPEWVVPVRW